MSGFAKFLKESNHGFPFTDVISQNKYLYNLVLELQEMLITEFDCEVLVKTTKDISYSPCVIYTLLISAGLVKPLIRVNYNKANEIEFMVEIKLPTKPIYRGIELEYKSPCDGILSGYSDRGIQDNLGFTEGFECLIYEINYILKMNLKNEA